MGRGEKMKTLRPETVLILVLGIGIILPILINLVSTIIVPNLVIENVLFHFILEMVGAVIAILLAGILIFKKQKLPLAYLWMTCAFMSMGILSFLHALTSPGNNFVWLYSLSVFFGGLFFSLVWIPMPKKLKNDMRFFKIVVFIAFLIISGIGILSLFYINLVPLMLVNGEFSLIAKLLNTIGGILSLVAAFYFITKYVKINSWNFLILIFLCSLLGGVAISFQFSALWDISWWSWHVLRVVAYIPAVFMLLKSPSSNVFQEDR